MHGRDTQQRQAQRDALKFLRELLLLALVVYLGWAIYTGRISTPLTRNLAQQQTVDRLAAYRNDYQADVGAIYPYKNQMMNMPPSPSRDVIMSQLEDVQARCRDDAARYDELAVSEQDSALKARGLPASLDPVACD
jgi:hypothetical protein